MLHDEHERREFRGEDGHVDQQQPMQHHRRHGQNQVAVLHVFGGLAHLGRPCVGRSRAPEHRLVRAHGREEQRQHEACKAIKVAQVAGEWYPQEAEGLPIAVAGGPPPRMAYQHAHHAEAVGDHPAAEDRDTNLDVLLRPCLGQDGLTEHEHEQAEQETQLGQDELPPHDTAPEGVRHQDNHGVGDDGLGFRRLRHGSETLRNEALGVDDQVLHVVIHTSQTFLRRSRTPHEALEQHWQQGGCLFHQTPDDVLVAGEELVHAIVVALAVRADRKQVL
mmetsp:Transcript_67414/g.195240  ORF Transcript_67414/g.195240 Transcript_67414/m.195240 type:complete len:277 (-) Transcript_67414:349-1179(-)